MAVLIAMVTQVVGDSVARAFSLVGALSIVRFRTVVRDTQDTAFVIFAVVVGMACGASDPRLALIGIGVVGVAAFLMRPKRLAIESRPPSRTPWTSGSRPTPISKRTLAPTLDAHASDRQLTSVSTAKQGAAVDATYLIQFRTRTAARRARPSPQWLDQVIDVEIKTSVQRRGSDDDD